MPLIPAPVRQRQENFRVQVQHGLESQFKDSQGYTEEPFLKKKNKQTKTKNKETKNQKTNKKPHENKQTNKQTNKNKNKKTPKKNPKYKQTKKNELIFLFRVFVFLYEVENCSFNVCEELCWNLDGDCTESIDCFR
jgi:methionine aminopeptidase